MRPAEGQLRTAKYSSNAARKIYGHVRSNPRHEVAGVLVGERTSNDRIKISAAIPSPQIGEATSVTFTQESWEIILAELDSEYHEDEIVGWYHSHPGLGIFLSQHDLFIHREFFSGWWQVAVVVDPQAGIEGLFGWRHGEVKKLHEREIPDVSPPIDPDPPTDPYQAPVAPVAQDLPDSFPGVQDEPGVHMYGSPAEPTEGSGGWSLRGYPFLGLLVPLIIGVACGWALTGIGGGDEPVAQPAGVTQPAEPAASEGEGGGGGGQGGGGNGDAAGPTASPGPAAADASAAGEGSSFETTTPSTDGLTKEACLNKLDATGALPAECEDVPGYPW